MKKLCFILLLLLSGLNVWASTVHTYPASADDQSKELEVEFNGEIATVTLYKSGALADYIDSWPGPVRSLPEWENVKYINFVSEDGA